MHSLCYLVQTTSSGTFKPELGRYPIVQSAGTIELGGAGVWSVDSVSLLVQPEKVVCVWGGGFDRLVEAFSGHE